MSFSILVMGVKLRDVASQLSLVEQCCLAAVSKICTTFSLCEISYSHVGEYEV
jgi:hypothetical protein